MARIYEQLVKEHGFSPAQKIIIDQIPPNSKVLEIGSSSGYLTKAFFEKGCQVDIVELDFSDLKKAQKYAKDSFQGSIEDPKVQAQIKSEYEYIVCADVLEHLVNPEIILEFLKSKLKKQGEIIISIPNVAYWGMRKQLLFKGNFDYQDSGLLDRTHLRFYSYNGFLNLLRRLDFKVKEVFPAETHFPFEITISRIPLLGLIFKHFLRNKIIWRWPNLSFYHYVIKASKG